MAIKVLYIEGDCASTITMDVKKFSAKACLKWHNDGRNDADDWTILDDEKHAGMHFVQLEENVEGETRKFIFRG